MFLRLASDVFLCTNPSSAWQTRGKANGNLWTLSTKYKKAIIFEIKFWEVYDSTPFTLYKPFVFYLYFNCILFVFVPSNQPTLIASCPGWVMWRAPLWVEEELLSCWEHCIHPPLYPTSIPPSQHFLVICVSKSAW